MAKPRQPERIKRLSVQAKWASGPRTSRWDELWARLLAYAMEHRALPDEMNGADARRAPTDSEPSSRSDDSRQPDPD